ncbi:MAG: 3-keto-disaccharide hydrolase [Akkermansiaceae bacterium]
MKTVCSLVIALFTAGSALADHHGKKGANQLTDEEKKAGWTLLFDGKSTEHFRNYKKDDLNPKWQVKNGALTLTAKGGRDLITKKQYEAFEFTVDYKISKKGNSGLMFHVQETEKKPWQTGPEIQIQDNVDGYDPQKAGWLYQLYKPAEGVDATKPVGEWNTLRILITPKKCAHWMNGTKYVEYVKGSKDWDERVAKSKFSAFPQFGKPTKGHLCLQDHGNVVSFRNIKIREIQN